MDPQMKKLRVTKDFTDFCEHNTTNENKGEENAHIRGKGKKKVKNKITNENVMDLREYSYSIQLKYRTERNKCLQNLYMWSMKYIKVQKEENKLNSEVREILYRMKELSRKCKEDIMLIQKRNRVKETVKVTLQEELLTKLDQDMDNMDKKRIEKEMLLEEKEVIATFLKKEIDDENNSKKKLEKEYVENIKTMLEEITDEEIEVTESNFPEFVKPLLFPEMKQIKIIPVMEMNKVHVTDETNTEESVGKLDKFQYQIGKILTVNQANQVKEDVIANESIEEFYPEGKLVQIIQMYLAEQHFENYVDEVITETPESEPMKMGCVIQMKHSDEIVETNSEENLGTVEKIPYPVKVMEDIIYMDNDDNEDEFETALNLEWDNYRACVNLMEEDDNFYKKIMVINTDEKREVNIHEPVETFTVCKENEMKIIFTDEKDIVVKNDYEKFNISQRDRNHITFNDKDMIPWNFKKKMQIQMKSLSNGRGSDVSKHEEKENRKFEIFVRNLNSYYEKKYREKFQKLWKKEIIPTKVEEISCTLILILMIWRSNHLKVPDKLNKKPPCEWPTW